LKKKTVVEWKESTSFGCADESTGG